MVLELHSLVSHKSHRTLNKLCESSEQPRIQARIADSAAVYISTI